MNSISNISILPEINSTSIWHTLVDNVLNGIAYLFAAILSTRARKIETAPVGVLQNTSAIETVLDIYGNAILRLAYSYLHNMSDAEDILQDTLIKYMQSSPAFLTESHHLYYQEGYPTKEISKILNRNESSIRSDLKRGREALKQVLKAAYDFE